MSASAGPVAPEVARPHPLTRLAAVLVLIALAGVAAYALFAAPTRVQVSGGGQASPQARPQAPAPPRNEGDEGGGSRD